MFVTVGTVRRTTLPTLVARVAVAVGAAAGVSVPPCCGSQLEMTVPPSSATTSGRESR
jgi:hypothetical protein